MRWTWRKGLLLQACFLYKELPGFLFGTSALAFLPAKGEPSLSLSTLARPVVREGWMQAVTFYGFPQGV